MKNRYEASPAVRVPIIWDHKNLGLSLFPV